MKQTLLIVAAGKSSRFGGYPKALAKIGQTTNVENTIQYASPYFEKIYLAVSEENLPLFERIGERCVVFGIQTGNGEAHSLLKCLRQLRTIDPLCKRIFVCWGDAYFVSGTPFAQLREAGAALSDNVSVLVACSEDHTPYAWFETDHMCIRKTHFASVDGLIDTGLHDQSLFLFNVDLAIEYLEKYKQHLKVADEYDPYGAEMKLLYSFEYLYNNGEYLPAQYVLIEGKNVISFNTKKELENIRKMTCL